MHDVMRYYGNIMENNVKKEDIEVLKSLFKELTDMYRNAGCNDWYFPEHWSVQQRRDFYEDVVADEKYEGYVEEDEELSDEDLKSGPCLMDIDVAYYILRKVLKEIEE